MSYGFKPFTNSASHSYDLEILGLANISIESTIFKSLSLTNIADYESKSALMCDPDVVSASR